MPATINHHSSTQSVGWIGIDVGSRLIKLAQVARTRLGLELLNSLVMPRNSAGFDSRFHPLTPDESQQLVAACEQFAGGEIAISASLSAGRYQVLELPPDGPPDVSLLVQRELEQETGSDGDFSHSFWPINPDGRSGREPIPYAVLSVPRNFLDELARGFLRTDLTCRVCDGLPFALSRIGLFQPAGTALIIDWGFTSCTFQISLEGHPGLTRTVRRAGLAALLQLISERLGVSLPQAEALLRKPAVAPNLTRDEPPNLLHALAVPALDLLTGELQRTLEFISRRYPRQQPDQLLLAGGGASLPGIAGYLEEQTGLPCAVAALTSPFSCSPGGDGLLAAAAALSLLGLA